MLGRTPRSTVRMPIRQVELVVRRPGHPERRLILGVGTIHLGRGEDNEIVLPDIGVSRRHAQIRVDPQSVVVSDLSSGNGTFVGGQRIASHTVRDGDEVFIDPFVLAFHVKSEQSLPPPTATSPSGAPTVHFSERDGSTQGRLVVLQGQRLDASYPIGGPRLTMGRAENHDVVLFDPAASRQHAEIRANGNDYWVVDPGSANGTFVNGHRIRETRLKHGDRIRVGATEFRFELVPTAEAAPPSPPADRAPAPPPRDEHWSEVTGRTEPRTREPTNDAAAAPAIHPRPSPPPPPAPIDRASPQPVEDAAPPPPIEPPVESRPAIPSAADIPRASPPPVNLGESPVVPTLESPPPPAPTPVAAKSPPHDSPSRARMGDTIVPDELPEPASDPIPWTSGPHSAPAPRTEAFVEESPELTPASPFGAEIAAVFSMAPPPVSGPAPAPPRVDVPAAPSPTPASSVSLDAPRPAPLRPTTPPMYPSDSDPTVRAIPPRATPAVLPPAPVRPAPPPPPPARAPVAPRPSAAPTQPPTRTRSMVAPVAAILAGLVLLGFLGAAALIALAFAIRADAFDEPSAGPAEIPAATSSGLAQLGMHLMKTPALSADAARAFYHAARLDPADGSSARLAAVACESAAIAELRYDIERRTMSDEEKKRVRDEALATTGDDARQAALERAARLLPADVELRSALDVARQKRLEEIRSALATASGERSPSGG
jgi:pSer/pThr/pTyr-binding forkhead associated (FHA) protein